MMPEESWTVFNDKKWRLHKWGHSDFSSPTCDFKASENVPCELLWGPPWCPNMTSTDHIFENMIDFETTWISYFENHTGNEHPFDTSSGRFYARGGLSHEDQHNPLDIPNGLFSHIIPPRNKALIGRFGGKKSDNHTVKSTFKYGQSPVTPPKKAQNPELRTFF